MAKAKASKEERKAVRDARQMIEYVKGIDGNEAETRKRVERVFEDMLGYDLKYLSSEKAVHGAGETEHVDFAVQLEQGTDACPMVMVEVKRVGIELARKHLKQVTSYAINAGCDWILLTNGVEWKVYHVEFAQPPKLDMLDNWNLLEDDIDELVEKFQIISYRSVKRDGLNKLWQRAKVVAPGSLLGAIVAQETLATIKRNLRKNTGILVDNEEVLVGIRKLLNETAAVALSKVKIPASSTRTRKCKPKQEKRQTETEVAISAEAEVASEGG